MKLWGIDLGGTKIECAVLDTEQTIIRKRLATGRSFLLKELEKPQPNLRDSWYPWMLAFGLGKQVDVWSSHNTPTTTSASTWGHGTSRTSSSSSSTSTGWSGGGGLSGGAGASGTLGRSCGRHGGWNRSAKFEQFQRWIVRWRRRWGMVGIRGRLGGRRPPLQRAVRECRGAL